MTKTITQSIGHGGYNTSLDDIKTVQELLNKVPPWSGGPDPKLVIEGKNWGANWHRTLEAIKTFQEAKFNGWSDGRIDPEQFGGKTMTELNKYDQNIFPVDPPDIPPDLPYPPGIPTAPIVPIIPKTTSGTRSRWSIVQDTDLTNPGVKIPELPIASIKGGGMQITVKLTNNNSLEHHRYTEETHQYLCNIAAVSFGTDSVLPPKSVVSSIEPYFRQLSKLTLPSFEKHGAIFKANSKMQVDELMSNDFLGPFMYIKCSGGAVGFHGIKAGILMLGCTELLFASAFASLVFPLLALKVAMSTCNAIAFPASVGPGVKVGVDATIGIGHTILADGNLDL